MRMKAMSNVLLTNTNNELYNIKIHCICGDTIAHLTIFSFPFLTIHLPWWIRYQHPLRIKLAFIWSGQWYFMANYSADVVSFIYYWSWPVFTCCPVVLFLPCTPANRWYSSSQSLPFLTLLTTLLTFWWKQEQWF